MICERAKDSFSEYYEGTLSVGLRTTLERHLNECPACSYEFGLFRKVYEAVSQPVTTDVPDDLLERINRALDKAEWERKQAAKPVLTWMRVGAYTAATAVILAAAYFGSSLWQNQRTGIRAGLVPVITVPQPSIEVMNGEIRLRYKPNNATTLSIFSGGTDWESLPPSNAKKLATINLKAKQECNTPLVFRGESTALLWISEGEAPETLLVIVPGQAVTIDGGDQRLVSVLKDIAEKFGVVIQARLTKGDILVPALSEDSNPLQALQGVLEGTGLRVRIEKGFYSIQ